VFYVTTDNNTRRIADRIAAHMRSRGLDSRPVAIISEEASHLDWRRVRGAAMATSSAQRRYPAEAVAFARIHKRELSDLPSLLVTVAAAPLDDRIGAAKPADRFEAETGWHPWRSAGIAKGQAAPRTPWLTRFIGRRSRTRPLPPTPDAAEIEQYADQLAGDVRRREIGAA
jgi:menaquinone-dependent protoporphyrinogen IX oxidase